MIHKYKTSKDIPLGVHNFADNALQNLLDAHDSVIESRVTQKHHANKQYDKEPVYEIKALTI